MSEFRKICGDKGHKYKGHEVGIEASLSSLKENSEIIIRKVDKGGGLVIQDKDQYLEEAFRLIGGTDTYERLLWDPTELQ